MRAALWFVAITAALNSPPSAPSDESSTGLILVVEHHFAASPEAVLRAWTEPDAVARWFTHGAYVHWIEPPVIDLRPGGLYRWSVVSDSNSRDIFAFRGRYRVVKAAEELVFRWEWQVLPIDGVEGPGNTVVKVQFLRESGGTRLVLTQTGLPSQAARDAHEKGWRRCFEGMSAYLASGLPSNDFIRYRSPTIALEHLRVIDGTGAPARSNQTIVISKGRIQEIGNWQSIRVPADAQRIDLTGLSALPGLVGMHDHLFYSVNHFGEDGIRAYDMPFSFPRLYLASGVTTIRTTGSFEPYTDLEIKKAVDQGTLVGPKMNVTGPYLEGAPFPLIQIHKLTGPDDARRTVEYWADEGVGSFKVYANITRAELAAAIGAAHRRGLTVTGHLCSIGFREAAEMGIDGLEHGLFVDSEFVEGKQPDVCPDPPRASAADLDVQGEPIQTTIRTLVDRHVAVTSTLPPWEEFLPAQGDLPERVRRALSPEALAAYEAHQKRFLRDSQDPLSASYPTIQRYRKMLRKEMEFERAFVKAGGLLLAGSDGVLGGDIAGFGDQRELEMLVEAGFSPLDAIKVATLNGAKFLKLDDHVGMLAKDRQADIVIVHGDPSANIRDIENVEIVFKDGVGYDSARLIESVKGLVGIR
jgi:imidazolonepropionase-like amidohydrolase/uncharacterized protein YndB with AHSA1/START domain